jgi:hypothetical protein
LGGIEIKEVDTAHWSRNWHLNFTAFKDALKASESNEEIKKINRLILTFGQTLITFGKLPNFFDENREVNQRYSQSLMFTSFVEISKILHQTVFLSACYLYKNANHNIRYSLEFILQSYYIDEEYPNDDFSKRITELREIEGNRKYRGRALVDKLEIPAEIKEHVKTVYENLHKKVHAGHEQFYLTAHHVMENKHQSVYYDENELRKISKGVFNVLDFFYFLLLTRFPELKINLLNNKDFTDSIEIIDMPLTFDKLMGNIP